MTRTAKEDESYFEPIRKNKVCVAFSMYSPVVEYIHKRLEAPHHFTEAYRQISQAMPPKIRASVSRLIAYQLDETERIPKDLYYAAINTKINMNEPETLRKQKQAIRRLIEHNKTAEAQSNKNEVPFPFAAYALISQILGVKEEETIQGLERKLQSLQGTGRKSRF